MAKVDSLGHNPKANIWVTRNFTPQSLLTATWTKVLFTDSVGETYNINHTPGTGDFTVNEDGWYKIVYSVAIDGVGGGNTREAKIKLNSIYIIPVVQLPIGSPQNLQRLKRQSIIPLTITDELSLYAWQNSGNTLQMRGENRTYFKIIRIR